jgi:hypothetical protein
MWSPSEILHQSLDAVRRLDADLRAAQAVHGTDALDERALHPVIAESLSAAGFGVLREVVYPGENAAGVRRSARVRCDLVLVPEPGMVLADPAAEQAALDAGDGTLFAPLADRIGPAPGAVGPGEAFWLEVKSVAQHAYVDGVPAPNRAYAGQLVRGPTIDLVKLAVDASIWTGGVLLVLFCQDEEVGRHDLSTVAHRLLDQDLPLATPEFGGVRIDDRVGNAWCAMGLFPLRAGG